MQRTRYDASTSRWNSIADISKNTLTTPNKTDIILAKIIIPDDGRIAAFTSMRKSATDYAVLNCAVSRKDDEYRVVVGSRPGRAIYAEAAQEYLSRNSLDNDTATEAGKLAAENLQFGDNPRGSARYRKAICPVLVKRALMEVMHGN